MSERERAGASSATYRKVVNRVAKVLRVAPNHSRYPSEDFETISDAIDEKSRQRALEWYRRGIRRGFEEACDALVAGSLELKDGTLYCPSEVEVTVSVKFRGIPREEKDFCFSAHDFGFE